MGSQIASSLERAIDETNDNLLDTVVGNSSIADVLQEILTFLMQKGQFEVCVNYCSQGDRGYEVNDRIEYDGESDSFRLVHGPSSSRPGDNDSDQYSQETPLSYIGKLRFPDSITSVEFSFELGSREDAISRNMFLNAFEEVTGTEMVPLGEHSYMTLVTYEPKVRLSYE